MQINATTLEQSVRFPRGKELPKPETLIELLNQLSSAQEANERDRAFSLEEKIRALVSPGVYEGYLDDDSLRVYTVRVDSITRRGTNANAHTFRITLEILDGTDVLEVRLMELIDFLRPVNRMRSCQTERQHVGPRFWPF